MDLINLLICQVVFKFNNEIWYQNKFNCTIFIWYKIKVLSILKEDIIFDDSPDDFPLYA